jgi:hypothetical protein
MRKVFLAAVLSMGFAAIASAAPPSTQQDGVVTAVNRSGKTFTAQTGSSTSSYDTTDRTIFRVGTTPTSWAAVKIGSKVGIVYHLNGQTPIADEVVIGD